MGGGDHRHVTKTLASTTNFRAIATANQVPDQPTYFFLKSNLSPVFVTHCWQDYCAAVDVDARRLARVQEWRGVLRFGSWLGKKI